MAISFNDVSRMTLFRGFDENFIKLLNLFFVESNYEPEKYLVQQGEVQSKFFVIIAGEVDISHTVEGREVKINTLEAGDFFGEMNLFDPGQATASVIAMTPVKTLEISNDKFRYFINYKPELAADFTFQLTQTIVQRFRKSNTTFVKELTKPIPSLEELKELEKERAEAKQSQNTPET